jgi:Tol biopolymer transport system component
VNQVSTSVESNLLTYARQTSDVNIWRYDIGTAPGAIISSTRWESNPDISKDGTKIAFVSDQSGTHEVWTADADGANAVQLTEMGGPLTSMPTWSPDGSKLAFVTWQDGAADIYTIEAAGGTPQAVVTSDAEDISPSWSAEGRYLYFSSNRDNGYQIWKKDLSNPDDEPTQVTTIGGLAAFESEDGSSVYFVRPNEPGIWRIDSEAGEISMIIDSLEPTDWGNWEITSDGIYIIRRFQGKALVTFYSFRTKQSRNIATLTNVPDDPSFSVSSDGKWLLFSRIDRRESDIILMEENG